MNGILKGIDAINFDNAYETFKGISELNNYEFIKLNRSTDSETIKIPSKLYYFKEDTFNIEVPKNNKVYITAELINIGIKYLEILDLDGITLKFKKIDRDLEELLECLEIDYIVDNTIESFYEFSMIDSENNENIIGMGDNTKLQINFQTLNHMLKDNEIKFNKTNLDVYIIAESEKLMQDAFIIGTSLRDMGIKTEIDYSDVSLKEKVIRAKESDTTYMIIVNETDLKKYSVRLIDAKTEEEEIVSINTLQDKLYINF